MVRRLILALLTLLPILAAGLMTALFILRSSHPTPAELEQAAGS
jgi:hypothetical protein